MDRFMENVSVPKIASNCWIWTGKKDRKGYGLMHAYRENGEPFNTGAHRISWSLFRGKIEPGKIICHHCDIPVCVNPAHLFIGTHKDNVDDMYKKGRRVVSGFPGEKNSGCKITEEIVKKIRDDYSSKKYSQEQIGSFYGLKQSQISRIIRGESWKHLLLGGE